MTKVFEYSRVVDGKMRREFVFLASNADCDLLQAVHDAAVDLCLQAENNHLCDEGGLSFGQIMEIITPEMLVPYGLTMKRIDEMAVQTDQMPPLVSQYELKTIRDARRAEKRRARDVVDYAERAARRLETQKANHHPVVSTWGSERISARAASWAWQFVTGEEKDFAKFIEKRLQAIRTHHAYRDLLPGQDSDGSETYGNDTTPLLTEDEAAGVPITQ